MKNVKRILLVVLAIVYFVVSLSVTTCLITFNDYRVSEFGNKSLIIVNDKNKVEKQKNGSLLVLEKDLDNLKIGNKILYYNTYDNQEGIEQGLINGLEKVNKTETTIELENGNYLSSEYLIGSLDNAESYNTVGALLNILESRIGYLFIIILPILIVFIYEIYILVKEIKKNKAKKMVDNEISKESSKK